MPAQQNKMLSRAAKITLGYLIVAGLWILLSDTLVARLVRQADLLASVQTWKGAGFVLTTGLILYALLRNYGSGTQPAPVEMAPPDRLRAVLLGLTFFFLAVLAVGFGSLFYKQQEEIHKKHLYDQQAAIAKLKAEQIARWIAWHREVAEHLLDDPDLIDTVSQSNKGADADGPIGQRLRVRFDNLLKSGRWAGIGLYGSDGRALVRAGRNEEPDAAFLTAIRQAAEGNKFILNDIQDIGNAGYRIDFLLPITVGAGRTERAAVLVLSADPRQSLFAMAASWPIPSQSSESLLVRRDGDDVVFLTPLRHSASQPLALRMPLKNTDAPAVHAVLEGTGVIEGVDYRGRPVLAAFRPIEGSSWHIIAKTDTEEVMRPLRQQARLIFALVVFAIGLAALFVALIWRGQRAAFALAQQRSREEREALERHFGSLFSQARDIILLIDPDGRIVQANDAAVAAYGYGKEELSLLNVRDLRASTTLQDFERQFALSDRPGGTKFETEHRRKDGSTFPVEVSSRGIDIGGKRYRQSFIRDISERRRAEAALREQEARLRTITGAALDAIVMVDPRGAVVFWNPAAEAMFGYTAAEALGRDMHDLLAPESMRPMAKAGFEAFSRSGRGAVVGKVTEIAALHADGRHLPAELAVSPIPFGERWGAVGIVRNIAERKRQQAEILRLNRAYATLSQTNGAIVHADKPEALFERICRIAVDSGGYLGAWIGMVDPDGKAILPVASAGVLDDYIRGLRIGLDPPQAPENSGPTATAVRSGNPFWCNDFMNNPATAPWHERARQFGIRASAALPLRRRNHVVGALNLYAGDVAAFDEPMRSLLEEMAGDLSFALENFDREALRRQAEESVRESEALFRGIVQQNVAAIFMIDGDRVLFANPRACEILGYPPGGLDGMNPLRLIAETDRADIAGMMENVLSGRLESVERNFSGIRRDGTPVDIGARAVRVLYDKKPVILGVAQDIGERKKAQEEIQRYVARLEHAMMATVEAVSTMVELRDPYTSGHERRVGELAAAIGEEMGLSGDAVTGLRMTGYVHDIGKISVPAEILSKPGRLTEFEFELIKGHARSGYDILKKVEFPWPLPEVILQHHERLDGSGYPQGLKGDEIILEARIMAVADVVEAMASHRPYRPGLGLDKALEEIERNSGRFYDSRVVEACMRLFREKGYELPK